jgi:hypothetical protein
MHTFTLEKRRAVMDGWPVENHEQPIRLYERLGLKGKKPEARLAPGF